MMDSFKKRKVIGSLSKKVQQKKGSCKLSLISLFILLVIQQAYLPNAALVPGAQK